VDGQGDGRNSTLLNPAADMLPHGSKPLSVPGRAKTPGRKGTGRLGEGRTGNSGRGYPKEIKPPLSSGNGRLGESAWPALGECWAIKPMGANQRGRPNGRDISRAKTCRTKGRGQGPRGRRLRAGEMGEGDPTLLDPAFGSPSRAKKGPLNFR
jgi:hypothetical protein